MRLQKKNERMRAVLYVRVSTDKQEVENQILQLRRYCQRVDYTIVREYVDVISGRKDSRPAFNQMFKDAHKYLFDIVVFWDISRFSRSGLAFTTQKLQELKNLKIGWDSYKEEFFRSAGPLKDILLALMTTLAKIEAEKISERTKAGLERAVAAGVKLGRPKGSSDKKPRRKKGYYDNTNWRKNSAWAMEGESTETKNRGSNIEPPFTDEKTDKNKEQINAP